MNRLLKILFIALLPATAMAQNLAPETDCRNIIYSKWNDLLFVNNGERKFATYQWYCDHVALEGETRQFLYTKGVVLQGDGHVYHVVVTTTTGTIVTSCEGEFDDFPHSAPLNGGGMEQTDISEKRITNGQLLILRGDCIYNLFGQRVE